jgi:hypothetical protein
LKFEIGKTYAFKYVTEFLISSLKFRMAFQKNVNRQVKDVENEKMRKEVKSYDFR